MKYLTDEDTKFKGREHYVKLKKRFNRPDINNWYEKIYRQPTSIGFVSEFFKTANPVSLENAYDLYLTSGNTDRDKPITKRGRTKEELEDLAVDWKKRCGIDLPVVDFYDALVLHAVVETCFGMIMERRAEDAYSSLGFSIEETDGDDDRSCGIDFIATKGDEKFLVQVKPDSFFRGDKGDLVDDRVKTWDKHRKGLEKYPTASYAYMIYDPAEKWLKKDGRANFRYSELINAEGKPIVNIDSKDFSHEDKPI